MIFVQLEKKPPPSVVVILLGSNDLVNNPIKDLIAQVTSDIKSLVDSLPQTVFIWSELLPRLYWHGASNSAAIERSRKRLNRAGIQAVLAGGYQTQYLLKGCRVVQARWSAFVECW